MFCSKGKELIICLTHKSLEKLSVYERVWDPTMNDAAFSSENLCLKRVHRSVGGANIYP